MSQGSSNPTQPNPYTAPSQDGIPVPPPANEGDGTGGMIPYKNPAALIAYYLGLFSLFPLLGLLLAVPAFVLGIIGLRNRRRNPAIRGSIHAWVGIIMGGIFTVIWGLMAIGIIAAVITEQ